MFTDNVKKYIARRRMKMYTLCDNVSERMEEVAKKVSSWKDRSGHARQSLNHDTQIKGEEIEMTVSHGVKYGKYLEKGTLPHDIKCTSKHDKEYIIRHPGSKPYPAITPAAEKGKELLKKYIDEIWR